MDFQLEKIFEFIQNSSRSFLREDYHTARVDGIIYYVYEEGGRYLSLTIDPECLVYSKYMIDLDTNNWYEIKSDSVTQVGENFSVEGFIISVYPISVGRDSVVSTDIFCN